MGKNSWESEDGLCWTSWCLGGEPAESSSLSTWNIRRTLEVKIFQDLFHLSPHYISSSAETS